MSISFIGGPAHGQTAGGPPQGPGAGGLSGLLGGGDAPAPQGDPTSLLKKLVADIHATMPALDDEQDKQDLAKCLVAIQAIIANEQKENDQAMQGKFSPRQMRKATGPSY